VSITFSISAQSYIELSVDNDLYFRTDHYYSSGIFISYGKKKENNIYYWTLAQHIYNPSFRYTNDISIMDYPYSGWLYAQYEREYFLKENSSYSYGFELGVTGDASLAKTFQNFYHKTFLNLPDLTWVGAQPQRIHFGIFGQINKVISITNEIHLLGQLYSKLSSHITNASVRFGIMMGSKNLLPFKRTNLNTNEDSTGIYFGTTQEYRPHDFTLSGSFRDDKSELILPSIKHRNNFEAGIYTRKDKWSISILYQLMSKFTPDQLFNNHEVLNLTIRKSI
jgi:hypothetical protein|tara:strand:- start:497 stop:1336 length:840 start_codon:yes stop_codon:yes gene_type:complete